MKIRTVFLNFNDTIIRGINFDKSSKKFVEVPFSTIHLNDSSNT